MTPVVWMLVAVILLLVAYIVWIRRTPGLQPGEEQIDALIKRLTVQHANAAVAQVGEARAAAVQSVATAAVTATRVATQEIAAATPSHLPGWTLDRPLPVIPQPNDPAVPAPSISADPPPTALAPVVPNVTAAPASDGGTIHSPDGAIMTATYSKNPYSNTPDWRLWSDLTPDGLPIFYALGGDGKPTNNGANYSVYFDGTYMPPDEVATYRARLAQHDANLKAQSGDVTYHGTVNPASMTDGNWAFYAANPALWAKNDAVFSGTLSEVNAALGLWFTNGNKNAAPEAGPLQAFV